MLAVGNDRGAAKVMKLFAVLAMAAVSLTAGAAGAQTPIQPGLWETNDKTTMEGVQPMPPTPEPAS